MIENNRKYPRTSVSVNVDLSLGENIKTSGMTTDVSEGGMFIKVDDPSPFPLGDMVVLTYEDPLNNNQKTTKDAAIVRSADSGIAIAFVDLDAF